MISFYEFLMASKSFELSATTQKSYYGKAHVIDLENCALLMSYDTIVCRIDKDEKKCCRLWNGYSKTTMNHINDFLRLFEMPTINKRIWESMPVLS